MGSIPQISRNRWLAFTQKLRITAGWSPQTTQAHLSQMADSRLIAPSIRIRHLRNLAKVIDATLRRHTSSTRKTQNQFQHITIVQVPATMRLTKDLARKLELLTFKTRLHGLSISLRQCQRLLHLSPSGRKCEITVL